MINLTAKDEFRQAAQALMEKRWIIRRDMPEEYLLIRRHETELRQFFREKCGWSLLVTAQFYKLEKVPSIPASFMGIAAMQTLEDYVLLACVMAFLEEYEAGGQFLLGDLAEALLAYYPEEAYTSRLNWESYNWRKSLIRVLKYISEEGILNIVDDESEDFINKGYNLDGGIAGEALYEVTSMARYFLRHFPKELSEYTSLEELAKADFKAEASEESMLQKQRRNRIYREILLKPVYYRNKESELDFAYLRNRRSRLAEDINDLFGLHLELYKNAVMAVSHEQSAWFKDVFPVRFRGIHDIILHFAHYLRGLPKGKINHPLSQIEWETHLSTVAQITKKGWTKEFREMNLSRLSGILMEEMKSWGMIYITEEGHIIIQSAVFRNEGEYPADYNGKE